MDAGLVAAAALGVIEAGGGLRVPPIGVAVALVVLAGLFWSRAAEETTPGTAGPMALAGVAAALVAGLVGRNGGLRSAGRRARARTRRGGDRSRGDDDLAHVDRARSPLAAHRTTDRGGAGSRPASPGSRRCSRSTRPARRSPRGSRRPDGSVRTSHAVAGDGTPARDPDAPVGASEGDGWLVLPVVDEGAIVGALGIARNRRAHRGRALDGEGDRRHPAVRPARSAAASGSGERTAQPRPGIGSPRAPAGAAVGSGARVEREPRSACST